MAAGGITLAKIDIECMAQLSCWLPLRTKYWEIIADRLSAAGYTWGYSGAVTGDGWRYIVDAHCGDGRKFIVESDELLTAFIELETMLL